MVLFWHGAGRDLLFVTHRIPCHISLIGIGVHVSRIEYQEHNHRATSLSCSDTKGTGIRAVWSCVLVYILRQTHRAYQGCRSLNLESNHHRSFPSIPHIVYQFLFVLSFCPFMSPDHTALLSPNHSHKHLLPRLVTLYPGDTKPNSVTICLDVLPW